MARKRKGRGKPGSFGSRLTRARNGIAQRLASLQEPDYGKMVIHVGTNDIRDCSVEETANTYVQLMEMMGAGADSSARALRYLDGPGGTDLTMNPDTGEVAMTDKDGGRNSFDLSPWVVDSMGPLAHDEEGDRYVAVGGQLCGRHTFLPHQRQTLRFLRQMMLCKPPHPVMPPGGSMDVLATNLPILDDVLLDGLPPGSFSKIGGVK